MQTNPLHRAENNNSHKTPEKATSSLFPFNMITKLEKTEGTVRQNI